MSNFLTVLEWVFIICGSIGIIWWLGLLLHTWNSRSFYKRIAMVMDKVKTEDLGEGKEKEKLMKLCFYRQITYEYSAYALLIICIGFLLACIYIFLKATDFVRMNINGIKLNVDQYLISVLSIRVGIALIIFFICQVLLKLYRYCLRFTAFYTGLFDALFIYKEIDKDFETAVQIFTIKESLEAAPDSPADKVIEILKNLK